MFPSRVHNIAVEFAKSQNISRKVSREFAGKGGGAVAGQNGNTGTRTHARTRTCPDYMISVRYDY